MIEVLLNYKFLFYFRNENQTVILIKIATQMFEVWGLRRLLQTAFENYFNFKQIYQTPYKTSTYSNEMLK